MALDQFVSFDGSTSRANTTRELVATWILGTYLCDAFDVIGYIWPTGERGSGKTQLLNTVTNLSFLGKTVTSGSSFATIRDEAHYGASLAFDDCEKVKDMENAKRELLLAGNTRGVCVSLKEAVGEGQWRTKNINSFAPRLFSSIMLPDPVLASRTISIPLVASTEAEKIRRSPARRSDWPFDIQEAIDELWLLAVANLNRVQQCDNEAATQSSLLGRSHDIFRIPLAVGFWLEKDHGISGLFKRLSSFAEEYHASKAENEGRDIIELALLSVSEALSKRAIAQISTQTVLNGIQSIAAQEDCAEEISDLNTHRVGKLLSRLGFKKGMGHGKQRSWLISKGDLQSAARARGVRLNEQELEKDYSGLATDLDSGAPRSSIVSKSDFMPF